jgi:hypothetical protein
MNFGNNPKIRLLLAYEKINNFKTMELKRKQNWSLNSHYNSNYAPFRPELIHLNDPKVHCRGKQLLNKKLVFGGKAINKDLGRM